MPAHRPTFYRRWLSAEGYLGLHLVAGLLLALAAGIAFDLVADVVFSTADLHRADARAQRLARRLESPRTTAVMQDISLFGTLPMLASMSLIVAAWLLKVRSHRRLYAFAAAVTGGAALNYLLKAYFHRARPDSPLVVTYGFSFPSGHAMGAMLFFGSLAYVIYFTIERHHVWRIVAVVACALAVLAIGTSRIYLGVHYFTDVVAGFFAGLSWMAVCLTGTEAWVRWRDYRRDRRPAAVPASVTRAGALLLLLLPRPAMGEAAVPPCAECVSWEATLGQAEALLAEPGELAGLDVIVPLGEGEPPPRDLLRRLRERGARAGLLLTFPAPLSGADDDAFRLKTRTTELRAQEPAAILGLEAAPGALSSLRNRGLEAYVDFVVVSGADAIAAGVPVWRRFTAAGPVLARDVLAATATSGRDRILAAAADPRVVLAVAGLRSAVEVSGQRLLTVEEVIARHQAAARRQQREVRSLIAGGRTVISFQVPGMAPPMTITADTVVYQAPGVSEVEQRDIRLNGLAYGTENGAVPSLPIIEPERVSAPPLAISLTDAYRYRLAGREALRGREAYVVAFEPRAEGASLFRGRAWIDAGSFAMVRVDAVQTGLRGAILSSQQDDEFVPVRIPADTVWLLGRSETHQVYSGAGHRTPIHRVLVLDRHEPNPPDFSARREAAHASGSVMLQDTEEGYRYLKRAEAADGPGEPGAPAPRRVPAGKAQRVRTLAAGVLVDPNIDHPLPFAGFSYVDFDFLGTGSHVNAFFGGTFAQLAFAVPSLAGTRLQLHGAGFATFAEYNDRSFRDGLEVYGENVRQRPARLAVGLVHPLGPRARARADYELGYTRYRRADYADPAFAPPASTPVHGVRLALEAQEGAWSASLWWGAARRQRWSAWGLPGNPESDPSATGYQRYGAEVARAFVFSTRAVGRAELEWVGGRDLDRFSRFSVDGFDNRLHGYPSAALRYDRGAVLRTAASWNAASHLRLDGFFDGAWVRDPGFGPREKGYLGVGAGLETALARRLLLAVEWGYGFQARNRDGAPGAHVLRATLLRIF